MGDYRESHISLNALYSGSEVHYCKFVQYLLGYFQRFVHRDVEFELGTVQYFPITYLDGSLIVHFLDHHLEFRR